MHGQRVSVVMAVYNGEKFLRAQLDSLLHDLGKQDEVIIVDDMSSDDSVAIIRSYADDRLQLHKNEQNAGVFSTFQRALSLAKNDIIFLCDQDDVWLPGKRAAYLQVFQSDAECLAVVSDGEWINETGEVILPSHMATRGGFRSDFLSTLIRNRYHGCFMAIHADLLSRALPIPPNVPMHDMWLGALATIYGNVHFIDRPYMQYRRHSFNVSPVKSQGIIQMIIWRWSLLGEVVKRFMIRSYYDLFD